MEATHPYAKVAQLHRLAKRQDGPRVRPLGPDDADVVALPSTGLARARRRHERDGVLPDPLTGVACDVYALDAGRIKVTAAAELGWKVGTAVDVQRRGDRLVISAVDPANVPQGKVKHVLPGDRLGLPAGLRAQVGLDDDAAAAVFTDVQAGEVVVVDARRLAALVIDRDEEC